MTNVIAPARSRRAITENIWVRFALRRTRRLLASLWVLVTAAFLMIHLVPGDPVRAALGLTAPQSLVEARREELGLNDPLWLQYVHYLGNVVTGNLGSSIRTDLPVADMIADRLPATLELAGYAFVLAVLIALPVGLAAAALTRNGRHRKGEVGFTTTTVVMGSIPEFLLAVGLVYIFAVSLQWLPVATRSDWTSFILPVASLILGPAAILSRLMRVEALAVLQSDFVRTARSKRIPAARLYFRHVLPNAATGTLTVAGLFLNSMIAGTVLVESVFAWPGLGSTIVDSIISRDYPTVQGIVLVYGLGVLLVNLAVDVTLALLDPTSTIKES